jgi:hypothetical protein
MSARALLVLVICAALGAAGCGSDEATRTVGAQGVDESEDLSVSRADVRRAGDAPFASALRWWRALQRREIAGALSAYADPPPAARVRAQVERLEDFLHTSKPRLLAASSGDETKTLELSILSAVFEPGGGPARIRELPARLELVHRNGRWLIAENSLLEELARAQGAEAAG